MKLMVINGPSINMLGIREVDIYGTESYESLIERIGQYAKERGIIVDCRQSNCEGTLIDYTQEAYFEKYDGIILNAGSYTHTSIALLDALKSINIPTVEVHISNVASREDFRRVSCIRPACALTISGMGIDGYFMAIDYFVNNQ